MTGTEFVRQVMLRLEVTTPSGLAEKMRWRRGMERTVARWLAGTSEPSFAYTFDMAAKAGMFSTDETGLTDLSGVSDLDGRLQLLAEANDELLAGQQRSLLKQDEMLAELREIHATLATARTGLRAGPKQKAQR